MLEQVRQSVGVENREKRARCILEYLWEAAGSGYHAQVAGSETFDRAEGAFRVSHHRAETDLFRRSRQGETAALAAMGLDEASAREAMHDLHQVIARNSIVLGNFRDEA